LLHTTLVAHSASLLVLGAVLTTQFVCATESLRGECCVTFLRKTCATYTITEPPTCRELTLRTRYRIGGVSELRYTTLTLAAYDTCDTRNSTIPIPA
jgi:hypothetical protein